MGLAESGVEGEILPAAEAWPVPFNAGETTGELRACLSRSSVLLRMLAMVKEVGVDLVVGEGFGLIGSTFFGSILSLSSD